MANCQGIAVSSSRFACLKIDDDEEAPITKTNKNMKTATQAQGSGSGTNAAKKKNKKKSSKDNDQLKLLAFGKNAAKLQNQQRNGSAKDGGDQRKTWDQWREHDHEIVEGQFKDDLAVALLQSRLELEQKHQNAVKQKERIEAGLEEPATREERKKKKQKEKPQVMSLEQFKQLPQEKVKNASDDSDDDVNAQMSAPAPQARVPTQQQDPKFFNSVQDDAEQILRQEKMQEEYRKQYASDTAIVARLKSDLEQKDQQIEDQRNHCKKLEEELKQVKKRNKQFCVILAQGEMKDKAQVLLQVDDLTIVKDELTEQVTLLTAEVEKEKSKNHALKSEIDKLKASKHGK